MTVVPTSSAEHAHSEAERMPDAGRVADGVWVVPLAIAPGHMPYTLSYLAADDVDGIHLIDAGWDLDGNLDAVAAASAHLGFRSGHLILWIAHRPLATRRYGRSGSE